MLWMAVDYFSLLKNDFCCCTNLVNVIRIVLDNVLVYVPTKIIIALWFGEYWLLHINRQLFWGKLSNNNDCHICSWHSNYCHSSTTSCIYAHIMSYLKRLQKLINVYLSLSLSLSFPVSIKKFALSYISYMSTPNASFTMITVGYI